MQTRFFTHNAAQKFAVLKIKIVYFNFFTLTLMNKKFQTVIVL